VGSKSIKLGSGLFYGESLRLIQEVRELNDQLNYERMEAYRLDKKIGEIKSQANAAEHHEKVAMRRWRTRLPLGMERIFRQTCPHPAGTLAGTGREGVAVMRRKGSRQLRGTINASEVKLLKNGPKVGPS